MFTFLQRPSVGTSSLRRGVMILQPVFDLVPFGSGNDSPPFHRTRSLAVFSHDVRILVEHFDHAVTLRALKAVPVGRRFEFFEGSRVFRNLPPRGACVCYTGQPTKRFLGLGRHVVGPLLFRKSRTDSHDFRVSACGVKRHQRRLSLALSLQLFRHLVLLPLLPLLFRQPLLIRLRSDPP